MMFGYKKKPPNPQQTPEPSFIENLIDAAIKRSGPETRLLELCSLWNRLRDLETDYGVRCAQSDMLRDELHDAFVDCDDLNLAIAAALSVEFLKKYNQFLKTEDFMILEPHLKLRLIKLYAYSLLAGTRIHPTEFVPANQHAFYALECQGVPASEMAVVLVKKYGIVGWKSPRQMNPHVIVDPAFPGE